MKNFEKIKGNMTLALSLLLALLTSLATPVHAARCGTPLLFQPEKEDLRASFKSSAFRVSRQEVNWARTFETEHFLIHYTLRGWHKVRTELEDASLMKSTDSLYKRFNALPIASQDSAVYAALDAMKVPHPTYILKVQDYFESAWKYYVRTLGMKAPAANIQSKQYQVFKNLTRKFPVDIVDMGTIDRIYNNQTYAVCFPPSELSILLENDFLWNTHLDSLGIIQGRPFKSEADGKLLHNYYEEWEQGLEVTVYHEFYHAVQFAYTPDFQAYHAWYEISAVGMEERNAPLVNDYIQYVPCLLKNHDRVSLTSMEDGFCTTYHVYANGLFHIFLSHKLDDQFDIKVWTELSRNGNLMPNALETTLAKYGFTMPEVYREYSTQLFFSGNKFPFPFPLEPFSPDMKIWTQIATDSIDMSDATPYRIIKLPKVTFAVLKITWNDRSVLKVLQTRGIQAITRIHTNADTSIIEQMDEAQLALGEPYSGFKEYYILIPNSSFTEEATLEIREPEARFFAFPNPVRTFGLTQLFFSQPKEMTYPARVEIYAENGVLVRTLNYSHQDMAMVWDLKNTKGEALKPGIYYYRLESETLRPLVLLR